MASRQEWTIKLPAEIIKHILSYLQPPSPEALGRARYEHIEFADERAEAVTQFTAASKKDLLPKLKTEDAEHRIGLLTLSNATCACRRFRDITQPLLYESFPGQSVANLRSLNRTLFGRPDLAEMFKKIMIEEWELDVFQGNRWWKTTIAEVGLSSQLIWAINSKAEAASEDAQVALLLCLCTEVQAIDISIPIMFQRASIVGMLMTEISQERPNTLFRGADKNYSSRMPASLPL